MIWQPYCIHITTMNFPYFQIKSEITEIVTKVNDRETISKCLRTEHVMLMRNHYWGQHQMTITPIMVMFLFNAQRGELYTLLLYDYIYDMIWGRLNWQQ